MARLIWLVPAKQDIERLHGFLKHRNPRAAKAVVIRVWHAREKR